MFRVTIDARVANNMRDECITRRSRVHGASTVASVVNKARPSNGVDERCRQQDVTIDALWRNLSSPEFGTKFYRKVSLFLEIGNANFLIT